MKESTKIIALVLAGVATLTISAFATANLYLKIVDERNMSKPTEINCVVHKHKYSPDELVCKVNGDAWIFKKDTTDEKANK